MLKRKKILSILLFSVVLMTFSNVFAGTILLNISTTVSPTSTYVSSSFVPTGKKVQVLLSGWGGSSGTVTYYLQKYNSGTWTTVDTESFAPNGGRTSIPTIQAGSTYRVRIISNVSAKVTGFVENR